jgi:uncharacterized protein (DUF433 family)
MNLPDFLTETEPGEIRLTGHRIGLFHVVHYYNQGYSPERLHEEFPSLPLDLIRKVVAFYEANRAEVDAYMARYYEQSERNRQAGKVIDIEDLKRRARAKGLLGADDKWL